jgi:hypothetical protein
VAVVEQMPKTGRASDDHGAGAEEKVGRLSFAANGWPNRRRIEAAAGHQVSARRGSACCRSLDRSSRCPR